MTSQWTGQSSSAKVGPDRKFGDSRAENIATSNKTLISGPRKLVNPRQNFVWEPKANSFRPNPCKVSLIPELQFPGWLMGFSKETYEHQGMSRASEQRHICKLQALLHLNILQSSSFQYRRRLSPYFRVADALYLIPECFLAIGHLASPLE